MLENIISFSLAILVLALSPGPDNIYVLSQSIANGTKSGFATTLGLTTGCIVHTTLLAFGLSAIITASPTIFYAIKIFGVAYLLFLAYKVFRSDSKISLTSSVSKKSFQKLFKQGVIMNIFNPKVMIFFLAFFPGFLWDKDGNTVMQFYVLGGVFMLMTLLIFGMIAMLAGKISNYLKSHKAVGPTLKWLQIIVFIGIAVYVLIP